MMMRAGIARHEAERVSQRSQPVNREFSDPLFKSILDDLNFDLNVNCSDGAVFSFKEDVVWTGIKNFDELVVDDPLVEVISLWSEAQANKELGDFLLSSETARDEALGSEDAISASQFDKPFKLH